MSTYKAQHGLTAALGKSKGKGKYGKGRCYGKGKGVRGLEDAWGQGWGYGGQQTQPQQPPLPGLGLMGLPAMCLLESKPITTNTKQHKIKTLPTQPNKPPIKTHNEYAKLARNADDKGSDDHGNDNTDGDDDYEHELHELVMVV